MALFGKKETDGESRCCSGTRAGLLGQNEAAAVKVLGSGCKKCAELASNAKEALHRLDMDASVCRVAGFGQIAAYGVMTTPALVLNEKVVSAGKVLKTEEIMALIKKHVNP